jgi:thiol-disulfide isomerase/thioredoxin
MHGHAVASGFGENGGMLARFIPTPRHLIKLALEVFLILTLVLGVEWYLVRDAAHGPAPTLSAVKLDGQGFDLRTVRGKPALVYFWATWCPVCAAQQSAVNSVLQEAPGITVAMRSGSASIRSHFAEAGLAWPVIDDSEGTLARAWGVTGVPAVFVLMAKGGSVS